LIVSSGLAAWNLPFVAALLLLWIFAGQLALVRLDGGRVNG
jgi:hypothetical protein